MSKKRLNSVCGVIEYCYGCGVCVASCPKKCIELDLDQCGFYRPVIKRTSACVNCGLCLSNCSFLDDSLARPNSVINGWAAWSNNPIIRRRSSSGGVAYELSLQALKEGYNVCGVKYNAREKRSEHCFCYREEDLSMLGGSKYIQSYTVDAFSKFRYEKKYLVIGTPCQIDSIRRYIRRHFKEENFILVDFFCHGVPSYCLWSKYQNIFLSSKTKLRDIEFRHKWNYSRNKSIPWHQSFVITGWTESGEALQPFADCWEEDWFYHFFLNDLCLGKQCYNHCKFGMLNSSADIRLGDAWGSTFEFDQKGISVVLAYTPKAVSIINALNDKSLHATSYHLDSLCEGQMHERPVIPRFYKLRLTMMRTRLSFKTIDRFFYFINKWERRFQRMYAYFCRNNNKS